MQKIEKICKRIVSDALMCEESEINHNTNLRKDLEADSMGFIEIILVAEVEFGIHISDIDVDKIETFGQFCEIVEKLKK